MCQYTIDTSNASIEMKFLFKVKLFKHFRKPCTRSFQTCKQSLSALILDMIFPKTFLCLILGRQWRYKTKCNDNSPAIISAYMHQKPVMNRRKKWKKMDTKQIFKNWNHKSLYVLSLHKISPHYQGGKNKQKIFWCSKLHTSAACKTFV